MTPRLNSFGSNFFRLISCLSFLRPLSRLRSLRVQARVWLSVPHRRSAIARFRKNARGMWSLRIFLLLTLVSLFAELLANDRPLVVFYKGALYCPLLTDYPETTFGGSFTTATDYHDDFVVESIAQNGFALWPVVRYRYDSHSLDLAGPAPSAPTAKHWLGTDDQARDVLARLVYGLRLSLWFGLTLALCASLIGVTVGLLQGYFAGRLDLWGQRFIELWSAMPQLYILIILASVITPSVSWLLFLMVLFSWTGLVSLVRAEVLRVRNFDYVRAARALGASHTRIMLRHVLPNALVATLTFIPFIAAGALVTLTGLDFLGLGLPPGSASIGELLAQGKNNLQAPWLGLTGFFVIASLLSLMVFIGEALRDAFDPRR